METTGGVLINFVAFDKPRGACLLVLVEGPWTLATEAHLRALQDRMYGCLESALDGQLAAKFPEAEGATIVVRVDCYDLPKVDVDDFVARFAAGIATLPDYAPEASTYVRAFEFEVNHRTLNDCQ